MVEIIKNNYKHLRDLDGGLFLVPNKDLDSLKVQYKNGSLGILRQDPFLIVTKTLIPIKSNTKTLIS